MLSCISTWLVRTVWYRAVVQYNKPHMLLATKIASDRVDPWCVWASEEVQRQEMGNRNRMK